MSTEPHSATASRLDYLDATRAFALVLGIVFHASLSFLPFFMGWAVQDVSTSPAVGLFVLISHSFRMELFFLLAGFFGYTVVRRIGTASFVRSRAVRLGVPFVIGWFILRPLISSGWVMGSASLRGDYDFWAAIKAGFASLQTLPAGVLTGTHLWFLYYLALVTALVLVARSLLSATGARAEALLGRADAAMAWLADTRWCLPVLVVPTAGVLWFMQMWGMDTPDRSLVPHIPVTLVYGGFFTFGWMLGRTPELIGRFARLSWPRWTAALLGIALTIVLAAIQGQPGHARYVEARAGFTAAYALMMWTLVLLTIGVFKRFCNRANPVVRYVADASYWLYLAHLPVVVWLQVAFAELPMHWLLKLSLISALTVAILLVSYDLIVRSTVIGQVLSGRRRPRVLFAPWTRPRPAQA